MILGVPVEIKKDEYRVGLTPHGVGVLVLDGHEVVVETEAGNGSGFSDQEYVEAGARIVSSADEVFESAEMIVKVKEPQPQETDRLRPGQILFTYLHLAPLPELTKALLERKVTGIAYETVTDDEGRLPLLGPMSEVAGRMASLVGSYYLQRPLKGRGALLSGVPGVPPGDVVVIGGGIVGLNAARSGGRSRRAGRGARHRHRQSCA